MDLAEKIKIYRKRKNLTQQELADTVGVSIMTMRRWEWNERIPRADEMSKLAAALGTTVGILMGESEPEPQKNLPINDAPENKTPEYLDLGYWGNVADNARRIAKIGSEQDKAAALMMLRMAADAITGAGDKQTGGNFIAVQENHQHVGDNYVKGVKND